MGKALFTSHLAERLGSGHPAPPSFQPMRGGMMMSAVWMLALALLCLAPEVHGKRIISYRNSHNDTRILWEQALRLGAPFQGDLYYWWGDDEPLLATYDLMTVDSGVPVEGEGSSYPFRGAPVQSIMAVSDGPLPVPLPEAQALSAAGKWSPLTGKLAGNQDVLEQAQAIRRNYEKARLRRGSRQTAAAGERGKPAIVYVTLTASASEEATFPAFSQEMLRRGGARRAKDGGGDRAQAHARGWSGHWHARKPRGRAS